MNSIQTLFDSNIAYAFAWTVVHSLWQSLLIALMLFISLLINKKQSASLRYLQGIAAMLLCVVVSAVTYHHYYSSAVIAGTTLANFGSELQLSYNGGFWEQFYTLLNANISYIVLIWIFGFTVQFSNYLRDFISALSLKNKGNQEVPCEWQSRVQVLVERLRIKKPVEVKNSQRVSSICVIGHLKPVILLPIGLITSLSRDEVEALLWHELGHIKRNDYLVNMMQCFVKTLYFFNPAMLWISATIDRERENACDDIAVKYCGNPTLYARSLTNIAALELSLNSVLAAKHSKFRMLPRVKRLFANSSGISKSFEQMASGVCVLAVIVAMNVKAEDFSLPVVQAESTPTVENRTSAADLQAPTMLKAAFESPAPLEKKAFVDQQQGSNTIVSRAELPKPAPTISASPARDYQMTLTERSQQKAISAEPKQSTVRLAAAAADSPNAASPGSRLEAMDSPHFNEFYVSSQIALPMTRKIYLQPVDVSFAPVWLQRWSGQTTSSYRDYVLRNYGEAFTNSLRDMFEQVGWQVVDQPSTDAITLKTKMIDLYIFEPETSGIKDTLIAQVGQAGVEFEFAGPNDVTFMKIRDHRNTQTTPGGPTIANRATNFRYFQKLMNDWSQSGVSYLQRIMHLVEKQKHQGA